jgi:hypothetical protein
MCSKIHGYSDHASGCQNLPQQHNFPKYIGTFENACFLKKLQKIVGLFNDSQWFCSRVLFWKNEKGVLKVRPESLRSRWHKAIARSAHPPSAMSCGRLACGAFLIPCWRILSPLLFIPFPSSF